MNEQNYEEYWKVTQAFTDFNGHGFLTTLEICVDFIDNYLDEPYSEEKYQRLQFEINETLPKDFPSIRKSINQMVKMGFVFPFLKGYHPQTRDYLNANTNRKRRTLLSKIVYSNASLNSSVSKFERPKELNFLIKNLVEHGKLSIEEITGLMLVDLREVHEEFLTREMLDDYKNYAIEINFKERKYNQIQHFTNLLGKLDDLVFREGNLYFEEDAKRIFGEDLGSTKKKRDQYLHNLYKNQLKEECEELYGSVICVLEGLDYPVLIASHIKPFSLSEGDEEYDPNNGLLLSKTIDSLFDLLYISFYDDGSIMFSNRISENVRAFWEDYRLAENILNEKRLAYLEFHRNLLIAKDAQQ